MSGEMPSVTLEISSLRRVRCMMILNGQHMELIMGLLLEHLAQILDGLDQPANGFIIGGYEFSIQALASGTDEQNIRSALVEVFPTSSGIRSYIMIEWTPFSQKH